MLSKIGFKDIFFLKKFDNLDKIFLKIIEDTILFHQENYLLLSH